MNQILDGDGQGNVQHALTPSLSSASPTSAVAKPRVDTLDGMRALAAVSIMIVHLIPPGHWLWYLMLHSPLGVTFFFVLAGFLLSYPLIGSLKRIDDKQAGVMGTIANLQSKRAIRLLPTYLVVVIGAALLGMKNGYASLPWLVTFTSNWGIMYEATPFVHATHLWYLAAQEQVFLVWPLIILLVPRRWLFPVLLAALFSGPAMRVVLSLPVWDFPWLMRRISPFAVVDMIAAGSCLAWLMRSKGKESYALSRWPACLFWAGLIGTIVISTARYYSMGRLNWFLPVHHTVQNVASAADVTFAVFFEAILFAWMIGKAWTGITGWPERILSTKPLLWLGALSYSIYLVHHYMIEVAPALAKWCNLPYPEPGLAQFLVLSSLSIVVAAGLYYAVEVPSNMLRQRLFAKR